MVDSYLRKKFPSLCRCGSCMANSPALQIRYLRLHNKVVCWMDEGKITLDKNWSMEFWEDLDIWLLQLFDLIPKDFSKSGQWYLSLDSVASRFTKNFDWLDSPHALTLFKAKIIKFEEGK